MKTINKTKALMLKKALLLRKAKAAATKKKRRRIRQTLNRFHVFAVNANTGSSPKSTSGWTAVLTREGTTPLTANFDDFGAARFDNLNTLTNFSYTLRIRNADNEQLFQSNVPADREFFVARF